LLSLQRAAGNAAVTRLLTAQRAGEAGEAVANPQINNPFLSANPMAAFFKAFLSIVQLQGRMQQQANSLGVRDMQMMMALAKEDAEEIRRRGEAEAGEALADAIVALAGAAVSASSLRMPVGRSESEGATAESPVTLLGQAADSLRSGADEVTNSAASSVSGGGGSTRLDDAYATVMQTAMRSMAQQIDQHRADEPESCRAALEQVAKIELDEAAPKWQA
jgi:hypothetical protein